jgi:pimeloyl-ACP methyl ester carboxylesterase
LREPFFRCRDDSFLTENTMNKNVDVMLVHGAWADASCWRKVILLLRAEGYDVTAAQIPLTSLDDDIAVVRRLLSDRERPTVLVGHSYGGAVITGAATAMPRVDALVYITAFGLDEGESLDGLSRQGPPSPGSAAIRPDEHGFIWLDRDRLHAAFAADVTVDEAAVMAAVQKPLGVHAFAGVEGTPAWKSIPSWYLLCTDDAMIPLPAQQFMATRMGATTRSVAASHAVFMSKPEAVTALIVDAAEAVAATIGRLDQLAIA